MAASDGKAPKRRMRERDLAGIKANAKVHRGLVAQLVAEIEQCWDDLKDRQDEPARCLVVQRCDELTEIFGDSVEFKHVKCSPWNRETVVTGLPREWRRLDHPSKRRLQLAPFIERDMTLAELIAALDWRYDRTALVNGVAKWIAQHDSSKG